MAYEPALPMRASYGSLESTAKVRPYPRASPNDSSTTTTATSAVVANSALIFKNQPSFRSFAWGGTERRHGKRWVALFLAVGCLASGIIVATVWRQGSRGPASTATVMSKTSDFIDVMSEVGPVISEEADDDPPAIRLSSAAAAAGDALPLTFTALNFYHARDGKPAQDYPWLAGVKLVEPYRETTLRVEPARDGHTYRWEVHSDESSSLSASGEECVVVLTSLDEHMITLEEVGADGAVTRTLRETVMVKYVRREIRTLTDGEREELLDAMHQLWAVRVDDGDGKELYGDDYADIYAINRLHFKAACPAECDHFHDGLGFLTNHAMLANTFEYSLQRVNPKLTLPYWDFTIESSSAGSPDGGTGFESQASSPYFYDSWFGSSDPEDRMVKGGRWGYTPIPEMRTNNPGGIQPDVYNKLRAPWNINDRAYLTRGMGKMCRARIEDIYPWPTCEMHYELVTSLSDFYSWVWYAQYDPHGPVHVWIGGGLDCELAYDKLRGDIGEWATNKLILHSYLHRKSLYRDGYFKCEREAEPNESPNELSSSGVCGCLDYDLSQGDDYIDLYNSLVHIHEILGDADADTQRKVIATLCSTPMATGEHLQASSTFDPSFWPPHPTIDRLWMFTVLTGGMEDYNWPDQDITYTNSEGTTVSESVSLFTDTCNGHRGKDIFPFGLIEGDMTGFEVKTGIKGNTEKGNTLTNREILLALDPRANMLPYVYDTFKWDHCKSDGFNFADAFSNTAKVESKRGRPTFEKGVPRGPLYSRMATLDAERKANEIRINGSQ